MSNSVSACRGPQIECHRPLPLGSALFNIVINGIQVDLRGTCIRIFNDTGVKDIEYGYRPKQNSKFPQQADRPR